MGEHMLASDGQPQPRPLDDANRGHTPLKKGIEYARSICFVDARALVGDNEEGFVAFPMAVHGDHAAEW